MTNSENPEINLPYDLWFLILSFLPVKTLLRLRAASKPFLALIDDPNFASFHRRSFPANRHETRLFFLTRRTFPALEAAMDGGPYCSILSSVDGLALLSDAPYRFILGRGGLMLWNPSTRKTRRLPPPSWCVSQDVRHVALIGYDHLRRDYKVLLGQVHYITRHTQLGIYSVSKGTWKTLDNSVLGTLYRDPGSGVSFDGGVAWVESDYSEDHQRRRRLVLFDFGTEIARYTTLPSATTVDLGVRLRSANLFRVDGGRGLGLEAGGEVWELETETMTWTSLCKIGEEFMSLRWLVVRKEKGDIVFCRWLGNRRLKVGSYNIETKKMKIHEGIPENALDVGVHVESLVKLDLDLVDSDKSQSLIENRCSRIHEKIIDICSYHHFRI